MKNLFTIITLLFLISCKAQTVVSINTINQVSNSNKYFKDLDNNSQNFVGTWENTTGEITFRVILWKVERKALSNEINSFIDKIYGKFLIIKNAGQPNETVLHNSVKYYPQNGQTTTWAILGTPYKNNSFSPFIMDTCANGGNGVLEGTVTMEITNLVSSPLTANWSVKSSRDLDAGEYFSVPTNTILTKQ